MVMILEGSVVKKYACLLVIFILDHLYYSLSLPQDASLAFLALFKV